MQKTQSLRIWEWIKILLAIGLIVLIVSQVDLNELIALFRNASPIWLILSFVTYFLMSMTKALQYYVLIGGQITYPRMLYIVTIQNTVSNFVANSAGIASYLATLKLEDNIKLTRSAVIFITTKVMDIFFIGLFLGISSTMVWAQIQDLQLLIILLLAAIGFLLFLFGATVLLRKPFVRVMESLLRGFKLAQISVIQRGIESFKALAEQDHKLVLQLWQ
jgi:hypothetical protein